MGRETIAIFRDHLLPSTEGFVAAQGEGLNEYDVIYVGSKRVRGFDLPSESTITVSDGTVQGRAAELAFKLTSYAPSLEAELRRRNVRLVHAHFGMDGVLALPLARRLGIPLVVTFHGYDITVHDEYARKGPYVQRRYIRERNRLQAEGSLFLAVSEFIRDKLIEKGFPPERTAVHYIGVDSARFREHEPPEASRNVLYVGRLSPEKGGETVVRTMAVVQNKRPDIELLLLGDGPERARLEQLSEKLGVRATFLGHQPPGKVANHMAHARVLLGASQEVACGESEGFGLVFLEAQAAGLPVVATKIGGIPEAVRDRETGLLGSPGDYHGLAEHVLALASDDVLWTRMSRTGRARARSDFDIRKRTSALENLYRCLLQPPTTSEDAVGRSPAKMHTLSIPTTSRETDLVGLSHSNEAPTKRSDAI